MKGLSVWMYGEQIGSLSQQRGELSFAYSPEALKGGVGRPLLSASMPTRPQRYSGETSLAFFDGLLPEGEARRMIAHDFGVGVDDVIGLLKAIGRDCAGALVILPDGDVPGEAGIPEPITDDQVAERIRNLPIYPLGVDQRVRVSLAGMQGKLLLARVGGGWGLPIDGAPSTHIIKPLHSLFSNMVSNEALCMRIAYHLGISAAKVEVGEFDGMQVLIVERYDRSRTDQGKVVRLHQEDFCQAQGVRSEQKYEDRGGPSLSRCAKLLDQWSQDKDRLERLLDINTLNVIVGNGDAHAKNLSLLYSGGRQMWASLAPAYDVVSTVWYKTITTKSGDKRAVSTVPGMHVNGVRDINAVTKDDLVQEAVIWGVPQDKADARVSQLLLSAEDAVQRAAGEIEPPGDLVDMLHTRVRKISS